MPTYDYTCLDCHRRFEIFLSYKEYGTRPVACTHCQSSNVQRGVPRVRVLKTDAQRAAALADLPTLDAMDENNPQALAQMMRNMSGQMGADMPHEFNEMVDRLESGQSAEQIESALPGLGLGGGEEHTHDHSHHDHDHSHHHHEHSHE